jgi:hypothetical protein
MTWLRLRLGPIATLCAVTYIIGGVFAPAIAFACEGAGDEEPRLVNKEGKELIKNDFTGTSSRTTLNTVDRRTIECTSDTVEGTETRLDEGSMTVSLSGCTNLSRTAACTGGRRRNGDAAGSGELIIPVTWRLARVPGFDDVLWDNSIVNSPFRFMCGTIAAEVRGSFVASITVRRLGRSQKLEIAQKEGIQEPDEYENENGEKIKATLEMSEEEAAFEQAGIEGNEELTFEEEVEFLA